MRLRHLTSRSTLSAFLLCLALGLALALPDGSACAAGQAAQPAASGQTETLSTQDLQTLVDTLENDAERQKFIAQLKALIAARAQVAPPPQPAASEDLGTEIITALSARIQRASEALVNAAGVIFDLPELFAWAENQATDQAKRDAWLELFAKLIVVLGLAWAAGRATGFLLRRPRQLLEKRTDHVLWLRGVMLIVRMLVELVPIAVFLAIAYGALTVAAPSQLGRLVTLAIVNAVVIVRTVLAVARLLLAPPSASLRLFPIGEETASYWLVWLRRLVGLSVYGGFAVEAARLLGLPRGGYEVATKLIGLAVAALLVILVLQNRVPMARWIRGHREEKRSDTLHVLRARLAEIWHILALLYVAAIYAVWALRVAGGFEFILRASVLSVVILLAAKAFSSGEEGLLRRFFSIGTELKERFPTLEARADRYLPVLIQAVRVLVYAVAFFALLQVWGLGGLEWLVSDVGRRILSSLATILITVVITIMVWEAISIAIEVYLARHAADVRAAQRRLRAQTLLPLLRKTVSIVLVVIAALIVLSALGVNIAPLLAGAGVAGIAIGLGAQSLIKDLITGLFIVIEDTMAVGDVVDLGGNAGVVEAISIRTIRLRDLSGTVHTIPFSEVSKIKNLTKDFSYAVFDVGIAYREDVDQVIEVLKALGAEMQADPTFGSLILAPLEVLGLDRFADSAVIVRVRFMTRPIQQWTVMREFNRRIKRRFDELNIEIPFPHQTIYFGADKAGMAPPVRVLAEAPAPGKLPADASVMADSAGGESATPEPAR